MKNKYSIFSKALLLSRDQMQWLIDNAFGESKMRCEVDYVDQSICWFWNDTDSEEPELDEIFEKLAAELDVKCITWIGPTFDGDVVIVYEDQSFSRALPWADENGGAS